MTDSRPLADLLRPETPDGFIGQKKLETRLKHLFGGKRLPSLLLYGPPGCGKSTLALLLARSTGLPFIRVSAPEMGLARLRASLKSRSILILDELHRFSKAQQDFFLPLLESGELTLIATTTENPSFSVTRQLLSRLHTLKLEPLSHSELTEIADRGLKKLGATLPPESVRLLAARAGGDARSLLNLVELAAALPEDQRSPQELRSALPEFLQRHDKDGDSHYELASALVKSIRGSDVDAALYYLACLLEGGEDPRFICRRLILSASEDVGLADPDALNLAVSCQQAVEFVGMPEGFIPLAETVVYLALAKKSNSTYAAYINAARSIRQNGKQPVPLHLRNATTELQKKEGCGKDYKYPHNWPQSWIAQQYLPDALIGERFYQPRGNGAEPSLSQWWRKLRDSANSEK
ncbi:MAG: replication-associated recombination protein A [Desulfovibrio sp.]|nr:replication-associated recombination protein A [Desulfovibrio sp.]